MSFLRLKTQVSTFFEQQLDSTRQRLDSNLSSCLIENRTASRLTEALASLDSLDSNLEGRGGNIKPCNIGNIAQKAIDNELNYPQHQTNTATDQETLKETDPDLYDLIYGKPTEELLYNHLLTCPLCHVEAEQYCLYGAELGKAYDALLLRQGDAKLRRESLALRVDRACISGRSVFVPFSSIDAPPPPNSEPMTRYYGIGDSERPFVNHVMACKQCRPRSALYCADGLELKANA